MEVLACRRNLPADRLPITMQNPPSISLLICTANRPHFLDSALSRLEAGELLPDELVVVNGGDDEANRVVERHSSRYAAATLIQYPNRNLSTSRNVGLPYCTGDIVAMTDDDAEVAGDWLWRIRDLHTVNAEAGAVGGAVRGTRSERLLSRLADRVVFPSFPTRRTVRTLPGVNVSYKRTVVDRVGLFDETLFRGEDVDFNWRLQTLGYTLIYDPTIQVAHEHRTTVTSLLQQQYMYGRAYVLVRRKWPAMYCVYPHRLRTRRDCMKLAHCVLAIVYQPALQMRNLRSPLDVLLGYPLLFSHHAIWKLGMLRQFIGDLGWRSLNTKMHRPVPPEVTLLRQWRDGTVTNSITRDGSHQQTLHASR